jgi:hypothetical protein
VSVVGSSEEALFAKCANLVFVIFLKPQKMQWRWPLLELWMHNQKSRHEHKQSHSTELVEFESPKYSERNKILWINADTQRKIFEGSFVQKETQTVACWLRSWKTTEVLSELPL